MAFNYCISLISIDVENGNANYSSVDGVLFDKEKTILFRYPAGKTNSIYVIPNGVTTIENGAFDYSGALASVTIPNSVTTIGYYAFYYCQALTLVTNLNPDPIDISNFGVFGGIEISACTLRVLESSISAYQAAPIWQDFIIEGIVGVENYSTPALVVYPNPTTGVLRITSDESQVTGIEIFDVSGRKLPMSTASLKSLETLIDISRLTTGLYFLKINTEAGQVIKKVLKE